MSNSLKKKKFFHSFLNYLTLVARNFRHLFTFSTFCTLSMPLLGRPSCSPEMISSSFMRILPSAKSVNRSRISMRTWFRWKRQCDETLLTYTQTKSFKLEMITLKWYMGKEWRSSVSDSERQEVWRHILRSEELAAISTLCCLGNLRQVPWICSIYHRILEIGSGNKCRRLLSKTQLTNVDASATRVVRTKVAARDLK